MTEPVDSPSAIKASRWRKLLVVTGILLGVQLLERLAFYGMATNLITYLVREMHLTNAAASTQIQAFWGACYLTPVLGAYVADASLGRYATIVAFSLVYLLGFTGLALQAATPALVPSPGEPLTAVQAAALWVSLYAVALGSGAVKPCLSTFGADQFSEDEPRERALMSRFFAFFYLATNIGCFGSAALIYVEQAVSWQLGLWCCLGAYAVAVVLLLAGSGMYKRTPPGGSPLQRIVRVAHAALAQRRAAKAADAAALTGTTGYMPLPSEADDGGGVGAAAAGGAAVQAVEGGSPGRFNLAEAQVEVRQLAALLPIAATMVAFNTLQMQESTLFILQGEGMDTHMAGTKVPAAMMGLVDAVTCIVVTVVYDAVVAPLFLKWGRPISNTQQVLLGYSLAIAGILTAGGVEVARMRLVAAGHLEDVDPEVQPPAISLLWQIPQWVLVGSSGVFVSIGGLEMFYQSSPPSMRSVATSLYLIAIAMGSYTSGGLVAAVDALTSSSDEGGWISANINRSRLDLFFLLLAAIMFVALAAFVPISRRFALQQKPPLDAEDDVFDEAQASFAEVMTVTSVPPTLGCSASNRQSLLEERKRSFRAARSMNLPAGHLDSFTDSFTDNA